MKRAEQSAQRSDAHQRRPYWFPRYFGGQSKVPGPRDRALSAYLRFSFFEFLLLNPFFKGTRNAAR